MLLLVGRLSSAAGTPFPGMPPMPGVRAGAEDDEADKDEQLALLRKQMEAMQKQLDAMARSKS